VALDMGIHDTAFSNQLYHGEKRMWFVMHGMVYKPTEQDPLESSCGYMAKKFMELDTNVT
jgi:uncharacterized protein (DUF2461 family)